MTHRFFLPREAFQSDGSTESVVFPAPVAHQLRTVLRMRTGGRAIVLDDSGWEYEVELVTLQGSHASARVCVRRETASEPRIKLVLYQGLLKGQHFEWVLQKGTELGVSVFVPTETGRSVARATERWAGKQARLERIIREAAEQSGRGRLPRLAEPLTFAEACQDAAGCDVAFVPTVLELGHRDAPPTAQEPVHGDAPATERGGRSGLAETLRALDARPHSVALLIGSEGGFQEDEVDLALQHGIRAVTLGPRVLRAETAAIVAAAIVLSELGEMS